jgi:hypothetical protein
MPFTDKQRRAAFAELARRRAGRAPQNFKGMSIEELEKYAHSDLEKKSMPGEDAAQALARRG